MLDASAIRSAAVALAAVLMAIGGAQAFDEAKYPDWSGQWHRIGGVQWDPSKPRSRGQQAPLTAEYQAIFDASLADQDTGGQGNDARFTCRSSGMPRIMTAVYPLEIIIQPKITCNENNNHVGIGRENYFLSADGYLMPAKKGQQPPDLRYFNQTRK